VRLLADLHIAPRTVEHLRALGHDVQRVSDVLPATASDESIVARAIEEGRTIITQDLDFSAIIALSGRRAPSLISLRLSSARVEHVNRVVADALPALEQAVVEGAIVTVEDRRARRRRLPIA
jgi:predicted nuclease of predicted toxin-antitoxin system